MVGEELCETGATCCLERDSRPETSMLKYEVVAGENVVQRLALQSR